MDNVPAVREAALVNRAMFGTIDTWLIWQLTGGVDGGAFVTDVTNASRTLLMNLRTLDWDPGILDTLGIPLSILPDIRRLASRKATRDQADGPLAENCP